MRIRKTANGNLEMTADRSVLRNGPYVPELAKAEAAFIRRVLGPLGYRQVRPEDVGALTSAPIITDGTDCWGFMNYDTTSLLRALAAGETVTWTKG